MMTYSNVADAAIGLLRLELLTAGLRKEVSKAIPLSDM